MKEVYTKREKAKLSVYFLREDIRKRHLLLSSKERIDIHNRLDKLNEKIDNKLT